MKQGTRWSRLVALLKSKRELARLNHIFIPAKKAERDRFRNSVAGRVIRPMFGAYGALSREGRAMFLVTLLIGFAGLDVIQTQVHLLFAMLSGIIVASLAARPFFRAHGLSVRVEAPVRVSVGESQRFVLTLSNRGKRRLTTLSVGAPFLPWDGEWIRAPQPVPLVAPSGASTTTAEARFIARGEHHLDAFEAGMLVPFGLAVGPRRISNGAKFLVVPRIAPVARLALEHTPPSAPDAQVATTAKGESEFAAVRPYRPGDPLKHLHARTWARTGSPHVKAYAAEKTERVGIVVVVDDDLATESRKEAAISLAAGVAAELVKSGSSLSLIVIDLDKFRIEPRTGRAALEAALDRLSVHSLTKRPEPIEESLAEVVPTLSSLVLVTADDGPRRQALVTNLVARGLPVRWLSVVEGEGVPAVTEASGPSGPTRVSVAAIDAEAGIPL